MAGAYARLTGKPACGLASSGPRVPTSSAEPALKMWKRNRVLLITQLLGEHRSPTLIGAGLTSS